MKKNWYDRNLGSQSKTGKAARKVTDFVGAKGIRQAAGDKAAGRKVNKTQLVKGVGNLALTVAGGAGLVRTTGKKVAAKALDPIKNWAAVKRKRQQSAMWASRKKK